MLTFMSLFLGKESIYSVKDTTNILLNVIAIRQN